MILVLLIVLVAIWITCIIHRPTATRKSEFRRRIKHEIPSDSMPTNSTGHHRAKPVQVREALFRIAIEAPDASCRMIANRFNHDHAEQGWSVGKTYVAEFLRDFRQWRSAPRRHTHAIDNACAVNRVWAIDLTQHRIEPQTQQPLLGILDHGSRYMLTLDALRTRSSIAILRLLLNAIEHYGKPKAIRTDNEAIFTSWVFAFALRWLGIRHERTMPHSPWMNGRIERIWSTFKHVLRMCHIPNDIALQATLNTLRDAYNQHRPHQSLSGYTPAEARRILIDRKRKRPSRSRPRRR